MRVIYGNEPYLIEQYKNQYSGMVTLGMNLSIIYGKYDGEVNNQLYSYPFMENRRVVILFCDTLTDLDTPLFYDYLENPPNFSEFLVIVKNVDSRLRIYKKLRSGKMLTECNKFGSQQFARAVWYEVSKHGAQISNDALKELYRRTNYSEIDSVNFIEIKSILQSLVSISKNITTDLVKEYVPERKAANIFALAEMIKRRQFPSLKEQISLIPPADSILVLSLMLKEFRISYKASMYSLREIGTTKVLFSNIAPKKLLSCISIINKVLIMVKTGQISNENALAYSTGMLIHELGKEE